MKPKTIHIQLHGLGIWRSYGQLETVLRQRDVIGIFHSLLRPTQSHTLSERVTEGALSHLYGWIGNLELDGLV